MQQVKVTVLKSTPPRKYSEVFKRKIVKEYEEGHFSKDQLMRKYQLRGKSSILAWCRKFGKFDYSSPRNLIVNMEDSKDKLIRELQKKLKHAEEKNIVLDSLLEITNNNLTADDKKKIDKSVLEVLRKKYG